jgi:biopolymer transport protein ExbD
MARRDLEEINAGSMADIAFLLLIFFLVTTTMEVDAGISRNLPFKRDAPPGYIPPKVNDRNILVIMANSRDELLVENQPMLLEDLEDKVRTFYIANRDGQDHIPTMPEYMVVTAGIANTEIAKLIPLRDAEQDPIAKGYFQQDIDKWEKRKDAAQKLGGTYNEISPQAIIQLKNQANTSYGLYIQIQDVLKKVVNDLRTEEAEYRWGVTYRDLLDSKTPEDLEKLQLLELLVPERIIEAKIEI